MKKFTKFLSVFMTAIMTLGMILPNMAFAATTKTNTVWVHKLVMDQTQLDGWESGAVQGAGYDGTQDFNALKPILGSLGYSEADPVDGVYFVVRDVESGKFVKNDGSLSELTDKTKLTAENAKNILGGETKGGQLKLDTSVITQDVKNKKEYAIVEIIQLSSYKVDGEVLTGSHPNTVETIIELPYENEKGIANEVHLYPKNTDDKPNIDKDFAGDEYDEEGNLINEFTESATPRDENESEGANAGTDTDRIGDRDKEKGSISRNIGDKIDYEAVTYIPKDAQYQSLSWKDTMSAGLTYNDDLVISVVDDKFELTADDYTITNNEDGFSVKFTTTGMQKVRDEAKKGSFNIKFVYSATLNEEAQLDTELPNTIEFTYNNTLDKENEETIKPKEPKVITHGKKFVKKDGTTIERLAGAEFVIKNADGKFLAVKTAKENAAAAAAMTTAKSDLATAIANYSEKMNAFNAAKTKWEEATEENKPAAKTTMDDAEKAMNDAKTAVTTKQEAYNDAFKAAFKGYKWVETQEEAYVLVSNDQGQFEIKGLEAGEYKLVEIKAPAGYALPSNPEFAFTVEKDSYTAGDIDYVLESNASDAQSIPNNKMTIPQTGGIGTAIFVIAGIVLMGGAFVAMKRQEA